MNKIFISTTIIFFFLCTGCVYVPYRAHIHRVPDEKSLASIKEGVTSKEEIIIMLGEPDRVRKNEKLFLYWWQEDHGAVISVSGAGPVRSTHSLLIEFDENNIVKKFEMKKKGIFSLGGQILPDEFFEW